MDEVLAIILLSILLVAAVVYSCYKSQLNDWVKRNVGGRETTEFVGDVVILLFFFLILWMQFQSEPEPFSDGIWFTCGILLSCLIVVVSFFVRHILEWDTDKIDSLLKVLGLIYVIFLLFAVYFRDLMEYWGT